MSLSTQLVLLPTYQGSVNVFDESHTHSGEIRQHWQYLWNSLNELGPQELNQRYSEARRLMRDNGIAYNTYSDPHESERPWSLDPIPLPIDSNEWQSIERGLQQRAELFRRLFANVYSSQEVLLKGVLPAELIFSHPNFLRPCVSLAVANDHYHLPLYAADLARTPAGSWCVIDDRSQAPPGAGYALENRLVINRILPSLFRDSRVHRQALYFRALRNTLTAMARRQRDDIRIVLLTPGPSSETYFEHAYLAKYLGYTLVEGYDLTVRDGGVWLKTLDGLQAVDVILRYADDTLCDPLELRPDSSFGIAALVQAARLQRVAIANPLGSGILDNPALLAFLPQLCKYFLGEDLLLSSPATYWCGLSQQRAHVLANLSRLVIKRTVASASSPAINANQLSKAQLAKLHQQIAAQPHLFVGQEPILPSTIPVFDGNTLQPRTMVLRSFLVQTETDFVAMPGGLCRVAAGPDMPVESVQSGGKSKDTWILASEPIQPVSLLRENLQNPFFVIHQGELPSRVAENLYWLGRYAERSESVIRLLRTVFLYLLSPDDDYSDTYNRVCLNNLLRAVTHVTETYPGFIGKGAKGRLEHPDAELLSVLLDKSRSGSLAFTLNALLYSARSVRDRISPDIWRVFNDIGTGLRQLQTPQSTLHFTSADNEALNSSLDELNQLLITFSAFTGLAIDSMTHGQGWYFLMLGRRLERAQQTLRLLITTIAEGDHEDSLLQEYLLHICDSLMTYRSRYRSQIQLIPMLELLLQDEKNPRAVGYQFKHMQRDIEGLPGMDHVFASKRTERRIILEATSTLRLARIEDILSVTDAKRPQLKQLLNHLNQLLPQLSDALSNSYFSHADQAQQLVTFTGSD